MKIAALVLVILALAGCADAPAQKAPMDESIAGTKWVMDVAREPDQKPRLEFAADGRVTGYSGCNMVSGTWKLEGGAVRLGPLISTKRACPGEGDTLERRFLQSVSGPGARIAMEGTRLVAQGEGGARMEFSRLP
jgi:putative lipoprotein